MDPALVVGLCALVALAALRLGHLLGRAEVKDRLRSCERQCEELRARLRMQSEFTTKAQRTQRRSADYTDSTDAN
jgi:hypothetical protein